jgi:signal transduction histidine kinase
MPAQTSKPYTPTLLRQGLVLVLIPGLLGSVLLLVLNQLWFDTGVLAIEEQKRNDFVCQLTDSFSNLVSFGFDLMTASFSGDTTYGARALEERKQLLSSIDKLQPIEFDKTTQSQVDDLRQMLRAIIQQTDEVSASVKKSRFSSDLARVARYAKMMASGVNFCQRMQDIVEYQNTQLDAGWNKLAQQYLVLRVFVFLMFFVACVTAVLLLINYARNMIRRLRVLANNANSLARLTEPKVRLDGNDELAYLDSVFYQVAEELKQAAEHRRSIMKMIAHDMRSPIMAAQIGIVIFEELMHESLSESQLKASAQAQAACDTVLDCVTDLVELEAPEEKESDPETTAATNHLKGEAPEISNNVFKSGAFRAGLLLTAFTIVIQFIFLFWTNEQVQKGEQMAALIHKETQLTLQTNLLWANTYRATYSVAIFLFDSQEYFWQKALKNLSDVRQTRETMMTLLSDNKELKGIIGETDDLVHKLDRLMASVSSPEQRSSGLSELTNVAEFGRSLNTDASAIFEKERQNLVAIRAKDDAFRARTQRIVLLAAPMNLLISLVILWFFTRIISERINMLVEVARKLPSREANTKVVRGSGEIELLYAHLCQALEDLRQADERRKSLMDMLANFIRAPLVELDGAMKVLEAASHENGPPRTEESLATAKLNISRALKLTDDLLVLDRFEIGKMDLQRQDDSVNEMIEEAVSSVAELAAGNSVGLKIECPATTRFNFDRRRMVQVLVNLITNAIKFSPENTTIAITVERNDDGIRIYIQDQGTGMDQQTLERIFDKFYRQPGQTVVGFGLGLTICKMIMESHGGTINARSQLGKGSTFCLFLPSKLD